MSNTGGEGRGSPPKITKGTIFACEEKNLYKNARNGMKESRTQKQKKSLAVAELQQKPATVTIGVPLLSQWPLTNGQ